MFFRQKTIILILLLAGLAVAVMLQAEEPILRGVVRDDSGPVAGAVVRLRGSDHYVQTDAQGRFELVIDDASRQLTAWAPGFYVAGSNLADFSGVLMLQPHPTQDNPDYSFISPVLDMDNPTACAHCHQDHSGTMGGALPVDEWLLDAHAGAATNPRFLSLYNGTTVEGDSSLPTTYTFDPAQGLNIPVAPSLGMDAAGPGYRLDFPQQTGSCATCHVPLLALAAPYQADPTLVEGVAAEGITCDLCHKIQDVTLRPDGRPDPGLPGVLSMQLLRPEEGEQVFIGPFDDTPGEDIYSAIQNESQVCAACHSGQFWDVPIYDSFGEWLDSPYSNPVSGQTCQDCHMPHSGATGFVQLPPDEMAAISARSPETIFSHRMPGAADANLLANTTTLEVETQRSIDHLIITVRVTNSGAGHHIPTDNPLRNLILWIQATDGTGKPLALLTGPTIPAWGGKGDPAEGYYAGQPGALYAKILADAYTGETPTYAYWRPTHLVSDNRIPALATDETAYVFALPAEAEFRLDVQLLLRRAFIDLMDAKGWTTPDMLLAEYQVNMP